MSAESPNFGQFASFTGHPPVAPSAVVGDFDVNWHEISGGVSSDWVQVLQGNPDRFALYLANSNTSGSVPYQFFKPTSQNFAYNQDVSQPPVLLTFRDVGPLIRSELWVYVSPGLMWGLHEIVYRPNR